MKLTEEQKTEIKNYIVTVPKYRETFNELYDHLVNSFEDGELAYSIEGINDIVNKDFGGFYEVAYQEKLYEKELSKKYNRHFRQEMLNTFKWPSILSNLCILAFCLLIYDGADKALFNMKPMVITIIIGVSAVAIFGFLKIITNRYRYSKYSILDNYFGYSCSFGFVMVSFSLHFLNKKNSFGISDSGRLLLLLSLFFFCSIYVRAFYKFYTKKYRVLFE